VGAGAGVFLWFYEAVELAGATIVGDVALAADDRDLGEGRPGSGRNVGAGLGGKWRDGVREGKNGGRAGHRNVEARHDGREFRYDEDAVVAIDGEDSAIGDQDLADGVDVGFVSDGEIVTSDLDGGVEVGNVEDEKAVRNSGGVGVNTHG